MTDRRWQNGCPYACVSCSVTGVALSLAHAVPWKLPGPIGMLPGCLCLSEPSPLWCFTVSLLSFFPCFRDCRGLVSSGPAVRLLPVLPTKRQAHERRGAGPVHCSVPQGHDSGGTSQVLGVLAAAHGGLCPPPADPDLPPGLHQVRLRQLAAGPRAVPIHGHPLRHLLAAHL